VHIGGSWIGLRLMAPRARARVLRFTLFLVLKASDEQIGLIAGLLAIRADGRYAIPDPSSQQPRDKTLTALLAYLSSQATQQPVLVLYEDIHWIDPSSLELLSRTVECIPHLPVLVLATARPEFRPSWAEEAHVTTLMLGRLDRHDAANLVARVAAGRMLSAETVEQILARSEGVPLFVEELTKAVLDAEPRSSSGVSTPTGLRACRSAPRRH
jgi:predicted ATPase